MRALLTGGVAVWAVLAQMPQSDGARAKDIAGLEERQVTLERQVTRMTEVLSALLDALNGANTIAHLMGSTMPLPDAPAAGSDSAPVTVIELADYHCPYCRRFAQDILPRLREEYIRTDRIRYMFVDFPLTELHPDSLRAHHAASCARKSGKYWEMHDELFARPATNEAAVIAAAAAIGLDIADFRSCMTNERYGTDTLASVAAARSLGISATPTTLVGITPKPGQAFVVQRYITGVQPFVAFKSAVEMTLLEAERHTDRR